MVPTVASLTTRPSADAKALKSGGSLKRVADQQSAFKKAKTTERDESTFEGVCKSCGETGHKWQSGSCAEGIAHEAAGWNGRGAPPLIKLSGGGVQGTKKRNN